MEKDLWEYVITHRWLKKEIKTIKEKQQDIVNITINEFFDFQRIKSQKRGILDFDWNKIDDIL